MSKPQTTDNAPVKTQTFSLAKIDVGPVAWDKKTNDAVFDPKSTDPADYIVHNKFFHDRHTYMTGLTSPGGFNGQSSAFFRLSSITLLWVADWTMGVWVQGTSDYPYVPDPESGPKGWHYLDAIIKLVSPKPGPDGVNPLYRVEGTYYYGLESPNDNVFNDAFLPRSAYVKDVFQRIVPSNRIVGSILSKDVFRLK